MKTRIYVTPAIQGLNISSVGPSLQQRGFCVTLLAMALQPDTSHKTHFITSDDEALSYNGKSSMWKETRAGKWAARRKEALPE